MPTLLRNARAVLPDRIIESADIMIEDGRISSISQASASENVADSAVDLNGLTLFPGFIDVHIHGAVGVDTMAATADDLLRVSEFLARQGVTAWLPTLVPGPPKQYQNAVQAISDGIREQAARREAALEYRLQSGVSYDKSPTRGGNGYAANARILGVHYEGPFVNSEQCGALHREHFKIYESESDLDELPTIDDSSALHMMTLAPEIDGGIELIAELKKRGWTVSIGHTRATSETLNHALASGAHHMTHFMNAMTPLHHRDLGAVGWGLIHDDVTCDVIADGIHIDREILKLIVHNKASERISLISDAIAATGKGDGEYRVWGEPITVKNGRTQNSRGSIAGSVITMLDAVRTMLSLNFSESEIALMAANNPANLLGVGDNCGSIAEGKRADLVAIDRDLTVRATIIGGQIARY